MGKAARWLKGLLGMKKEKKKENFDNSSFGGNGKRDNRRWSFAKSAKDSACLGHSQTPVKVQSSVSASDTDWLTSYVAENEKEQKKHAIAVAAATAAAADAAVAAAQAAVAVVRLTSQGRGALFSRSREKMAAVKIQTMFRGFLARKALRALKALVKLQSLVRGYLVRKRTAATLYSMQALIRAQTAVKNQRASRSLTKEQRFHPRKSYESFDEPRSEFHSQRVSAFHEVAFIESPKIVEIDTYKTRRWSSRRISSNNTLSEYDEDDTYNQPPLPCSDFKQFHQDFEWYLNGDECKFSTAQSTPRFGSFVRSNAPPTPAKSVCGDSFFRPYSNAPNYMADTKSFKAKLRSLSAPKQRPEPGPKKVALQEFMAARNSISGVRMQRSPHTHVRESLNY